MVVHFYLVRHGQTRLNRMHRLQGITDSPLTKKGAARAYKLGKRLNQVEFRAVYASDLKRTQATAEIIIAENQGPRPAIHCDPGLRELSFGSYEEMKNRRMIPAVLSKVKPGQIFSIVRGPKRVSRVVDLFKSANHGFKVENAQELNQRITRTLMQLGKKYEAQGGNILIVSHALILSVFIENLSGNLPFLLLQNTHLSRVDYENGKFKIIEIE
ncbi:histidine phosphatase family protein [Liquorilactobacillus satsumensis]|nr:histidine phosphatase family protein [Liquorilactobacillus satsumensis]MCC7667300.1 histidine phosphatase family protein [Liquorilactobacillus satsumensis]MCP9312399.1 histidine phosphatase family protein [Liquorilactobacillus satsumensis]MCP9327626.1 histidine phosphatase family protein [Liquorilactobacillus satsumensis]MCP9357102.1 histidine phosphatase family protein [Liquorilactobacillus satsumensis]MCP9359597.1 histidine phosphatase family protein [Liquorilactobacillus satsumensis]